MSKSLLHRARSRPRGAPLAGPAPHPAGCRHWTTTPTRARLPARSPRAEGTLSGGVRGRAGWRCEAHGNGTWWRGGDRERDKNTDGYTGGESTGLGHGVQIRRVGGWMGGWTDGWGCVGLCFGVAWGVRVRVRVNTGCRQRQRTAAGRRWSRRRVSPRPGPAPVLFARPARRCSAARGTRAPRP